MLAQSSPVQAVKNLWEMFKKEWVNTLIMIILVVLVSAIVGFIFYIPIMVVVGFTVLSAIGPIGIGTGAIPTLGLDSIMTALTANAIPIIIAGLIALVGMTIVQLMSIGAFYFL